MLRKLISKILLRLGKPPPEEEYYQYTDCVGFWINSCDEYDEYEEEWEEDEY